ncbi:hypothetical protein ABF237_002361 [Yersinia ruckeri]
MSQFLGVLFIQCGDLLLLLSLSGNGAIGRFQRLLVLAGAITPAFGLPLVVSGRQS